MLLSLGYTRRLLQQQTIQEFLGRSVLTITLGIGIIIIMHIFSHDWIEGGAYVALRGDGQTGLERGDLGNTILSHPEIRYWYRHWDLV